MRLPGRAADDPAPTFAVGASVDRIDASIVAVDEREIGDRDLVELPVNMAHVYFFKMSTGVTLYFTINLIISVESK